MLPAAGPVSQQPNNQPMLMGNVMSLVAHPNPAMVSDSFAKDAVIAWFWGEFAAANAIINALCNHLTQLEGGARSEYGSAFTAIHRWRLNWIPILQMQKYYSIADVSLELRKVAARRAEVAVACREAAVSVVAETNTTVSHASREEAVEDTRKGGGEAVLGD